MKKLKLKLNMNETLSRDEMKKIGGGYDARACLQFTCGTTCPIAPGWCSCVFVFPEEGDTGICLDG